MIIQKKTIARFIPKGSNRTLPTGGNLTADPPPKTKPKSW